MIFSLNENMRWKKKHKSQSCSSISICRFYSVSNNCCSTSQIKLSFFYLIKSSWKNKERSATIWNFRTSTETDVLLNKSNKTAAISRILNQNGSRLQDVIRIKHLAGVWMWRHTDGRPVKNIWAVVSLHKDVYDWIIPTIWGFMSEKTNTKSHRWLDLSQEYVWKRRAKHKW